MPPPVLPEFRHKVAGCDGSAATSCRLRLGFGQSASLTSRSRYARSNTPQLTSAVLPAAFLGSPRGAAAAVQIRVATPAVDGPVPLPDRAPAALASAAVARSTDGPCSGRTGMPRA